MIGKNDLRNRDRFDADRHVGDVFRYRLAEPNLIAFLAEDPQMRAQEKDTMAWKLTLALMLVSVAAVSALVGGGEPENEAVVREEAAKHLSALREHLLRR